TKPLQKKLKPTAVPHIFNLTPAESSATLKWRKRHIQREFMQNTQVCIGDVIMMDENTEIGCQKTVSSAPTEETVVPVYIPASTHTEETSTMDFWTQSGDQPMFSIQNI
ncbi:hypothetical protein ACJMK2_016518, partial [Sinanodonta woodiana]